MQTVLTQVIAHPFSNVRQVQVKRSRQPGRIPFGTLFIIYSSSPFKASVHAPTTQADRNMGQIGSQNRLNVTRILV
jgi:hypothetical protein